MYKRKFFKAMMPVLLTGLMICLSACPDDEALEDEGREASIEFCKCYKTKSKDKCFEELKSNYRNYEKSKFIDAFNEVNTCGIKLVWEPIE
jgi:hypothetical protein